MLFTAVSNISLSHNINTLIHMGTGRRAGVHSHTYTHASKDMLINTCTHSNTASHTKWHQSIENRHSSCQTKASFFPSFLQLSRYCTCLTFQALTLSVPSGLIFNAVHTGGVSISEEFARTCAQIRIHEEAHAAAEHEESCEPAYA